VEDQIEIDDTRGIARRSTSAEFCFDVEKRVEQRFGRKARMTDDHHVQEFRRRRTHRFGLDDRAHAHDRDHALQLIDRAAQIPATIAEIRAEGDDDGVGRHSSLTSI
jgi:hypothetical protein